MSLKLFKWFNYSIFWKLFGVVFCSVILCFLCALLFPSVWCLFGVIPICCIGGYFIRILLPDALKTIIKDTFK